MQNQEGATAHEEPQADAAEEAMTAKRVIYLHRDLLAFLTDLQTAADAKQSLRRTKSEEVIRLRLERIENSRVFSKEKLEEIKEGWRQTEKKTNLPDLLEALNRQETFCSELMEYKMKLIADLQREWEDGSERHSIDLRKQTEALDVMIDRMNQVRRMTMDNKELGQIESPHDVFLTQSLSEWDSYQKDLRAKAQEWLKERKAAMDEYENAMPKLELAQNECTTAKRAIDMKLTELEREQEEIKGKRAVLDARKLSCDEKPEVIYLLRKRVNTLKVQLSDIMKMISTEEDTFQRREQHLLEDIRSSMAQHKRIQKKIKHFALSDAQTFVEMSQMLVSEVKLLAESALAADSHLCTHLGLTWKRPEAVMERCYPIQPQDEFEMAAQVYAESLAEVDAKTMTALLELLCNELSFLIDTSDNLSLLETDHRTAEKMLALLNAFDFYADDLNRLVSFLLKYEEQHKERADQADGIAASVTSELIQPNNVLPAFLSFVSYRVHCIRSSALRHHLDWDADADKAFWEDMVRVIPEEKLRLWDAAEIALTQYLEVLEKNSKILQKNLNLEEENRALRKQLSCENDTSIFLLKDFLKRET
ncbi:dynein regulatory complex protein 1-like [Nerophis lumbriciformis]|uniref:dynein regulatory complex protein 1-like n=1 Tax=Nerophis lumbriciformis TaxID=546530 RepID=UPI003BAC29C8